MAQEIEDPCKYAAFLLRDMDRLLQPDAHEKWGNLEEKIGNHTRVFWSVFLDDEKTRQNLRDAAKIIEDKRGYHLYAPFYAQSNFEVLHLLEAASAEPSQRLIADILAEAPQRPKGLEVIDGILYVDGVPIQNKPQIDAERSPILNAAGFPRGPGVCKVLKKPA